MQSGQLTHRMQFEAEVRTPDGLSGFTSTWKVVVSVTYGALWPLKGNEIQDGGRTKGVATHRLRIRFRKPFSSQWRVRDLFNQRYFSIVTDPIDLYDEHTYLEMHVKETQP